ncbi:FG-GAP-like repeat-containing protein [Rosistilla oblonga]|nr:cadherin-like domain-containing protein [Rosistilla oblonga]
MKTNTQSTSTTSVRSAFNRDRSLRKRERLMEVLEDRVMFDGVPDGTLDPAAISQDEPQFEATADGPQTGDQSPESPTSAKQIVFVDKRVAGYEPLVADLTSDRESDVVFLNKQIDTLSQIADALADRNRVDGTIYDAVHLIETDAAGNSAANVVTLDPATIIANRTVQTGETNEPSAPDPASGVSVATVRTEVVVIDSAVQDAATMLAGLQGSADPSTNWIVVRIDPSSDGIQQISDTLARQSSVDALHLIGHGDGRGIDLGGIFLDVDSLSGYASDIALWGDAFSHDADILIYGCDLASTADGRTLVEAIAALTAADVAASDDATGHELLGGDWDFEYSIGDISTTPLAEAWSFDVSWYGTLAVITGTGGSDILEGTTSADTISGNGGNDIILGGVDLIDEGNFNSSATTTQSGVSTSNSGWDVDAGPVDFLGADSGIDLPNDPNDSNLRAVDLKDAAISRDVSGLTAGQIYNLAFFMAADGEATQSLDVSAVGGTVETKSVTMPSGNTLANIDWQAQLYTFTATATTHTIRFASTSGTSSAGPIIAAVRLVHNNASDGNDSLSGGGGIDLILGGGGADSLYADDDNQIDLVDGGGGGDYYYIYSNNTPDTYRDSGASGNDYLYLSTASAATYNIADEFSQAQTGIDTIYDTYSTSYTTQLGRSSHGTARNWDFTGITIQYIEQIHGGRQDDTITFDYSSTGAPTLVYGNGGNDTITTGNGNETIYGGDGDDTINAGGGDNTIRGEDGDDNITTGNGNDIIYGGTGADTIDAGNGNNTLYGDAGDDNITTGSGSDTIYGGAGVDTVDAGGGTDSLYLDDDNETDIVDGGEGSDSYYIYANNTADVYQDSGNTGTDYLYLYTNGPSTYYLTDVFTLAATGIDTIYDAYSTSYTTTLGISTHASALFWDFTGITIQYIEQIHGGTQDDTIIFDFSGTGSPALIYGNDGNDTITTSNGSQIVYGGDGDDTIDAGGGDDTIYGGAGDDEILGGGGEDVLWGGDGNDTIRGQAGADTIYGEGGDDTLDGDEGSDTIEGGSGADLIRGGTHADILRGQDGDDILYGDEGNDTLYGGDGVDVAFGGEGNDDFYFDDDSFEESLDGGEGADTYYVYSNRSPDVYQDTGIDGSTDTLQLMTSGAATYFISDNVSLASSGIESISSYYYSGVQNIGVATHPNAVDWDFTGIDLYYVTYIHGGTRADRIVVDDGGAGQITAIYGYGGDDTLIDGTAAHSLYGGDGNDSLYGGVGADSLYGDAGTDYATYDGDYADYNINRNNYTGNNNSGYLRVHEVVVNGVDEGNDFVYGTVEYLTFADGTYDVAADSFNAHQPPVISSVESVTAAFLEDGSPLPISSTLLLTDPDITQIQSAVLEITGTYVDGEDMLSFIDQNGITGVWDSGTGVLTLTGSATLAEYQTALRNVAFSTSSDLPDAGTRVVLITVNDGMFDSNIAARSITITSVNDDPSNVGSLPSDVNVTEDVLSYIDLSSIDLSDADHNGGNLTVILASASGGQLSASDSGGVTVVGSGTTSVSLSGTLADLNNYLDVTTSIQYLHGTANLNGNDADTIQIDLTDNGNTGTGGGGQIDLGTMNVDITAVNDEQVLATNTGDTVAEGSTANPVTAAMLQTTDIDNSDSQLVYTVDTAPVNGQLYRNAVALSATDTFTQADIAAGLITYDHDGSETTSDSFAFTVDDGAGTTTSGSFNWTITGVNDAPVASSIEETSLAYTENDGAVVVTSTLTLADDDLENLESATIQITSGYQSSEDVLGFVDQNGITGSWGAGTGTLTLTGSASVAHYQTALRSITYSNASELPDTTTRMVSFTVNDGDANSNTVARGISIASVNDAPFNAGSLPSDVTVTEDVLSDIDLSAIDLSDVDHNGGNLTLTLTTSTGGNLTATTSGGVTVADSGSMTLSLTGTLANLNTYLNTTTAIKYQHATTDLNGNDADTISVAVTDNGNTGNGGDGTIDLGTFNVDITAVNDEQVLAGNTGATVVEGSTGNTITAAMLQTTDVDNTNAQLVYTVDSIPVNGTLYRNVVALSATDTFTQADIAAGLITYDHNGSQTASDSFAFTVDDGAGTTTSAAFHWAITNVNDAPVAASIEDAPLAYTENDGALAITSTLTLADDDDTNIESALVTISAGYVNGQDLLAFVDQNGIVGAWDSGTGTLTLTGSASVAQYQSALRSVTYTNTSEQPSAANRTVSYRVNDGDGDGNTQSRNIAITAVNDLPTFVAPGTPIFTPHNIATNADGAYAVTTADVDGDGDLDVLSTSWLDKKINWYENDGSGSFTKHVATTTAAGATAASTADIDGDGDLDILAATHNNDRITWFENDGNENFTAHVITSTADLAVSVAAADVDGDGDIDVLSASYHDDKIAWYENDGNGNFTTHVITTIADGARTVTTADVDGDGDIDVLSASRFDDTVAWYENDGSQNFIRHVITANAGGAWFVTTSDVDGDGDLDVISALFDDDMVVWYENDGSENFTQHVIATTADGVLTVTATDVDGDGDIDVLSASELDHKIAWYENDGNQNFTTHVITTTADGAKTVATADIDGDGDIDILSASEDDDTIAWYENNLQALVNTLDGNPTFTEDGPAVVLDANVKVYDAELTVLNDFGGASLTLARNGGASPDDHFTATGNLAFVGTTIGNIEFSSAVIGTYSNTAGTLTLTFAAGVTNAQVNSAMQSIAYANSSDTPPASVQIAWTFDDGNSGDQGTGGPQQAIGSTTIDIIATNDDPANTGSLPIQISVTEDLSENVDLSLIDLSDSDAGSSNLTVTLTTSTGGNLSAAAAAGITVGGTSTVRTLTGSLIDLNSYLNTSSNITYLHGTPDTNGDAADTIQIHVTDNGNSGSGGGGIVDLGTFDVDITTVNDEQILAVNTGTTVVEGSTGNTITTAMLQTTDVDNTNAQLVYTVDSIPVNGTLYRNAVTLSANDTFTQADIAAGLITYDHNGSQTASDSFTFTVDDGTGTTTSDTFHWSVTSVNDAPVVASIESAVIAYTENDGAEAITSTLTLADDDDTNIESALVTISAGYVNGQDLLAFVDQNGIVGAWDAGTGTLTMTGTATLAQYQSALRSITYTNTSELPDTSTRTVSFTVNDGGLSSNTQTRDIALIAVNDAPLFVGSSIVVNGDFSAALNGWTASGSTDNLSNHRARFGQTAVPGVLTQTLNTVIGETYWFGFEYGDLSPTKSQSNHVVVTGDTTLLDTEITSDASYNLLRNYSFQFVADSSTTTLSFTDTSSSHAGVRGYLDNVVVAPLVAVAGISNYTENDSPTVINPEISIADVDDTHIESAVIQITNNFVNGEDLLEFTNSSNITGTWDAATGRLTLTGSDTLANYQAALRSIRYENLSDNPSNATRTVSFTVNDGDDNSNTQTRQIQIDPINDDPTNAGSLPSDVTVTEDVLSSIDLSAIDLSDVDHNGGNLTLTLTTSTGGKLTATTSGGVTVAGNGSTTLSLTGTLDSLNAYIDIAASIQYLHPTANLNGSAVDTIQVDVTDNGNSGNAGGATVLLGSIDVEVTPVNDAPVAVSDPVVPMNPAFITNETTSLARVDILSNDIDADHDPLTIVRINGNTFSIGVPITLPSGALVTVNGDGTIDFDSNGRFDDLAVGQSALDGFAYTISDGQGGTDTGQVIVTINGENEPPQIGDSKITIDPNTPTVIPVLENAYDSNGDPLSVIVISQPDNASVVVNSDGTLTFTPHKDYVGTVSFRYLVEDPHGGSATATLQVEVRAQFVFDNLHQPKNGFDRDDSGRFAAGGINRYGSHGGDSVYAGGSVDFQQPLSQQIYTLAPEPILSGQARYGSHIVGRIYDSSGRLIAESFTIADISGTWLLQFQGVRSFDYYRVEIELTDNYGHDSSSLSIGPSNSSYQSLQPLTQTSEPLTVQRVTRDTPSLSLQQAHRALNNPLGLGT